MHGLLSPGAPRPSVSWRMAVPGIILFIASAQFVLIFAEYLNLRLPVRLSVSWASSSSSSAGYSVLGGTAGQREAQARLTHIPGEFPAYDPTETGSYQWYTEAKLRELTACVTRGDCSPNADKVRRGRVL